MKFIDGINTILVNKVRNTIFVKILSVVMIIEDNITTRVDFLYKIFIYVVDTDHTLFPRLTFDYIFL